MDVPASRLFKTGDLVRWRHRTDPDIWFVARLTEPNPADGSDWAGTVTDTGTYNLLPGHVPGVAVTLNEKHLTHLTEQATPLVVVYVMIGSAAALLGLCVLTVLTGHGVIGLVLLAGFVVNTWLAYRAARRGREHAGGAA